MQPTSPSLVARSGRENLPLGAALTLERATAGGTGRASGFRVWAYRYAGAPPAPPSTTDGGIEDAGCGCRVNAAREHAPGALAWGALLGAAPRISKRR
jgi:hypothetical protein